MMNRTDLIDRMAAQTDMSKAVTKRVIDALIDDIKDVLCDDGSVTLAGFGTSLVGKRSSRNGHNPRTGAVIAIRDGKVAKFKLGRAPKDALNQRALALVGDNTGTGQSGLRRQHERVLNLVGRAALLQGAGREFELLNAHHRSYCRSNVGRSDPVWSGSSAGQNTGLSRRGSRV